MDCLKLAMFEGITTRSNLRRIVNCFKNVIARLSVVKVFKGYRVKAGLADYQGELNAKALNLENA